MASSYCPTSRTFCRLRSVLMRELELERHDIRPSLALFHQSSIDGQKRQQQRP